VAKPEGKIVSMGADIPLIWPVGTEAWMSTGDGWYRKVRISKDGYWEEVQPFQTHYNQEES
jgi:hypothetical protein